MFLAAAVGGLVYGLATGETETTSKNLYKSVNEIISKNVQKSSAGCKGSVAMDQVIDIVSAGDINISGVTQESVASINISCIQNSLKDSNLHNNITKDLVAESEAKLTNPLVMGKHKTDSSNETDIRSLVENITEQMSNLDVNSIVAANQTIKATAGGNAILSDVKQSITVDMVVSGMLADQAVAGASTEIAEKLDLRSKATTEGLSFNFMAILGFIIIIAVIGIAGTLVYKLSQGDKKSSRGGPQYRGHYPQSNYYRRG